MFNWQHVSALPLFFATIEVMLEESEQQYHYIKYLKEGKYRIEKNLIARIVNFYQNQLDKVMFYDEQFLRWANDANKKLDIKLIAEITKLQTIVMEIKKISHSIIELAKETTLEIDDKSLTLTIDKKFLLDFVDGKFKERE